MEEFKEKQKRQRVIVVEKYLYGEYDWEIDKIFTNVTKCYNIHFRAFFEHHKELHNFSYQSFINAIKTNQGVFENLDDNMVRFRYTIHQLE